MRVYQANFGEKNGFWPVCRGRNAILLYEDAEIAAVRGAGDEAALREAIVAYRGAVERRPNPGHAATVGYDISMVPTFAASDGDVWLHVEGDDLHWCLGARGYSTERGTDPRTRRPIVMMWKPTLEPWRDTSRGGRPLGLRMLHPAVRGSLKVLRRTFAQRRGPAADHVLALIGDVPEDAVGPRPPGPRVEERWRPLLAEIAAWALAAAARSGELRVGTHKDKATDLGPDELVRLLGGLLVAQRGRCAYTGLPMFDGFQEPAYRRASLDRIDSARGYERGNLHLVCRFVNRMKGEVSDGEFRQYLRLVRSAGSAGGARQGQA